MGPFTYADYAAMPDDGRRYELIDGELIMTPAPGTGHQWVVGELNELLRRHVGARRLGVVLASPLDVILSKSTTVQPDIVFLDRTRRGLMRKRGIVGSPALLVEVISPTRPNFDRREKQKLYARHGVPHYWIVDPEERHLEGFVLGARRYAKAVEFSGDAFATLAPFPNLAIPLATLWPPELPD